MSAITPTGSPAGRARPRRVVAGQHGLLAAGLDQHRDAAVEVGDQQDAGAALGDLGDPADQALAGHRGLALGDPLLVTRRDQQAAHERAARVADHPPGHLADRRVGAQVEEGAQGLVLGVEAPGRLLPLLEPGDLLPQVVVFLVDAGDLTDLADRRGDRVGGLAEHPEHWRQHVEEGRPHPLDHDDFGLAQQHQGERRRHQD
jgi:hypothetical protein